MNRTLGQVRIFGEGSTDISLRSFSGNRTALFYTVHDVFRNSDFFNNLIHQIAIVELNSEILRNFPADGISFGSVLAADCDNQMSHTVFLSHLISLFYLLFPIHRMKRKTGQGRSMVLCFLTSLSCSFHAMRFSLFL